MRRGWLILTMPLPRNVNNVTLFAGPSLGIKLPNGIVLFFSINNDHVMRNSMALIIRFWSIFNIGVSHIFLNCRNPTAGCRKTTLA